MATKKNENFLDFVEKKRLIEDQLKTVKNSLGATDCDQGRLSRLSIEAGDARMRLENFKSRYFKNGSIPKERYRDLKSLEKTYEDASELATAAKTKCEQLIQEKETLENELKDMIYEFTQVELVEVLQGYHDADAKLKNLQGLLAEHNTKKETTQKNLEKASSEVGRLKKKRQDTLASIATGEVEDQSALDAVDTEHLEATTKLNAEEQALKNSDDTISGLKKLISEAEMQLKSNLGNATEAVCHYLVGQAQIAEDRYSKLTAQVGQHYAELKAISKLLESVSNGNFNYKITSSPLRLQVPAFSVNSSSNPTPAPLLDANNIDFSLALDAEKEKLSKLGFTC